MIRGPADTPEQADTPRAIYEAAVAKAARKLAKNRTFQAYRTYWKAVSEAGVAYDEARGAIRPREPKDGADA